MKNLHLNGPCPGKDLIINGEQEFIDMSGLLLILFNEYKSDNVAYVGTYRFVEAKTNVPFDNKTWYHAFASGVFVHLVDVKNRKEYLCKSLYYEDDPWDLCLEKIDLKLPIWCRL